jgi:acetyl esterase
MQGDPETDAATGRHANAAWLSQVAGRTVEPPRRDEPQDLVDSRPFFESFTDLSDLPAVSETHLDLVLRRRDGVDLTAEVVVPLGTGPFPTYVHLHGGGFCVGSTRADRKLCHQIATAAGVVVVNVGYGLAPEHPFPWAVEDAVYATRWAVLNAGTFGADPTRVVLEGCSAGAGLAAATTAVLAGDDDGLDHGGLAHVDVDLVALVLFFGILDFPQLLMRPGSNVGSAELWARAYLGNHFTTRLHDTRVSPVRSSVLDRFPPTYVSCGSRDSLLGHSLGMIDALATAGVAVEASILEGIDHGFLKRPPDAGAKEFERAMRWVRSKLEETPPAPSTQPREEAEQP